MITIDSLTVRYGSLTALDGLTMHLTERAVHGLVGVNGAGKTSLFNAIYGFVTPAGGSVTRSGHPLRRRDMAYLESENFFYDGMTGRDMLDLAAHYHPTSDPAPYVGLFALPVDRPVAEWSAGMRKKLALTVTLMQRKPVLLLDEPFNGLDMESLYAAQQLILQRRAEGATILVSSHLLPTLEALCDDIRLIDGGRITAEYRRGEYPRAAGELEELFHRHYLTHFNGKIS